MFAVALSSPFLSRACCPTLNAAAWDVTFGIRGCVFGLPVVDRPSELFIEGVDLDEDTEWEVAVELRSAFGLRASESDEDEDVVTVDAGARGPLDFSLRDEAPVSVDCRMVGDDSACTPFSTRAVELGETGGRRASFWVGVSRLDVESWFALGRSEAAFFVRAVWSSRPP